MSQFFVVCGSVDEARWGRATSENRDFIGAVLDIYGHHPAEFWSPDMGAAEEMLVEIADAVREDRGLSETRLWRLVSEVSVSRNPLPILMWWGEYFDDLPVVESLPLLSESISSACANEDSSLEVYAHYLSGEET